MIFLLVRVKACSKRRTNHVPNLIQGVKYIISSVFATINSSILIMVDPNIKFDRLSRTLCIKFDHGSTRFQTSNLSCAEPNTFDQKN